MVDTGLWMIHSYEVEDVLSVRKSFCVSVYVCLFLLFFFVCPHLSMTLKKRGRDVV